MTNLLLIGLVESNVVSYIACKRETKTIEGTFLRVRVNFSILMREVEERRTSVSVVTRENTGVTNTVVCHFVILFVTLSMKQYFIGSKSKKEMINPTFIR